MHSMDDRMLYVQENYMYIQHAKIVRIFNFVLIRLGNWKARLRKRGTQPKNGCTHRHFHMHPGLETEI